MSCSSVIAIIAILAAILFPVFAQAKAAAKTTASISNLKQIGLGNKIYLNDNDDVYPMRKYTVTPLSGSPYTSSWKSLIYPYVKSVALYKDSVNPAAQFPDDASDPAFLATQSPAQVPGPLSFPRGYAIVDTPFIYSKDWNATTITDTQFDNPANIAMIMEHKRFWSDTGPYLNWGPDTSSSPGDPTPSFGNHLFGGGKWGDKAMVIAFRDGHAKRTANGVICGKANEVNVWGYERDQLTNWGGLGNVTWLDTFCQTLPTDVK